MGRFLPVVAFLAACSGGGSAPPGADLSGFDVARISVGAAEYEVWLARTPAQHQQGLMFATPAQLAPLPDGTERGMLFVFDTEAVVSFWMKDTIVPLDLAYARADGTITEQLSLVPLDLSPRTSSEPVQYALEVNAGSLAANGITPGTVILLPPGVP